MLGCNARMTSKQILTSAVLHLLPQFYKPNELRKRGTYVRNRVQCKVCASAQIEHLPNVMIYSCMPYDTSVL